MDSVFNLVKKSERNLLSGTPVKIGKYAEHDHAEKVNTIIAYLNSQHISGPTDSLGREKPFYNIVLPAVHSWFKLTDIDRKNIKFKAKNPKQRLKALIATILIRSWMDKENFGQVLNKWGWGLSCFGSTVLKFVEQGGKLAPSVVSWDRMICDPVDFTNNIKAEKLYFTPAQLRRQKLYDKDAVERAIDTFNESRTNLETEKIDERTDYIGVYEVHGEMPLSFLTGKEDDDEVYRQQMHVIFIQKSLKEDEADVEITLYSGKERQDPYYLTHLIEQDGRALSIGAVEMLFDAQWMMNHSTKQVKDQLDYSSKNILQTADSDFLGRNTMTDVDTGDVLIHEEGKPLAQVNTQSHDVPQIMAFMERWKLQSREVSSSHESVTGESAPSGTPYRLFAMLNQEARGLFDMMRENKGLHLEEIIRKYILPSFKKTLRNSDEVMAVLDGQELEELDELILPARLEARLRSKVMEGRIPTEEELMHSVMEENETMGHLRPLRPSENETKTWEEYFDGFEWDLDIEITGENVDKQAVFENLNSLLQTIAQNPAVLQDPNARKIFNKILDEVGPDVITPLHFSKITASPRQTGGEVAPITGGEQVGAAQIA